MDIQQSIKEQLISIFASLEAEIKESDITLLPSDNRSHGDYTSNIAFKKAKPLGMNPLQLAEEIAKKFVLDGVEKVEAVKPGFLNFFLKADELGSVISKIVSEGSHFGDSTIGQGKKVNLEYVSANPTGVLHLGHARGAAIGDSLARLYQKCGYDVCREYYVNDAGNQIENLGKSLIARYLELFSVQVEFPEDGYHGEEIITLAKKLKEEVGDKYLHNAYENIEFFKTYGSDYLLSLIKEDLHNFRVDQDYYSSEKALRSSGKVEKVLEQLKPYCYEQDGALFLNTTKDGDDKDRVIVKSDGCYTYLLPDIANHANKFERGFDLVIDLFGADHHGYITRLKSSQKDLGYNPDNLIVLLVQMVRLFKDGQEFKMSKRTGNAISMKELVDEVGVDAVRYFFVSRSTDSHLDFNIDLALTLGSENPVYYAQYTHARLFSIEKNGKEFFPIEYQSDLLGSESEKNLFLLLKDYQNVIESATKENEPYKVTNYIHALSQSINEFYTKCRVIDKSNVELTKQRLGLVQACRIVLANALSLIGVSAPDRMVSTEKE